MLGIFPRFNAQGWYPWFPSFQVKKWRLGTESVYAVGAGAAVAALVFPVDTCTDIHGAGPGACGRAAEVGIGKICAAARADARRHQEWLMVGPHWERVEAR